MSSMRPACSTASAASSSSAARRSETLEWTEQALEICERLDGPGRARALAVLHSLKRSVRRASSSAPPNATYGPSRSSARTGLAASPPCCTASATSRWTGATCPPPTATTARRSHSASQKRRRAAPSLLSRRPRLHRRPQRRRDHRGPAVDTRRAHRAARRLPHAAAERQRYERILTPALREEGEYRAGVADASQLDPLTTVADLLRR